MSAFFWPSNASRLFIWNCCFVAILTQTSRSPRQASVQRRSDTKRLQLDQAVIFRDQAAPEAPCASAALGPPTLEQITRGPLQQHRTYVCRWFSSHFKLHTHTGDLAAVSFFSFFLDSNRAATSITTSPLCRSFLRNDRRIAGLMTNRLIESLTK